MNTKLIMSSIVVMAIVTYLPRVLPFILFQGRIKNRWLQSFLSYMPYGILAAMIVPDIFTSTQHLYSAIGGCLCACLLAYKKLGLLPVASFAVLTVLLLEQLPLIF